MTAPIESIAAMTDQADADDITPSADAEPRPPAQPMPEAPLKPEAAALSAAPAAPAAPSVAAGARLRAARPVSPNAIIGLLGTLLVASLGAMTGLMMWQMSSLGDRIDKLDTKIDTKFDALHDKLDTKIDNKIDGLRAEMQAGFREVNATLLDHTDRLARLETALGLPRPADPHTESAVSAEGD